MRLARNFPTSESKARTALATNLGDQPVLPGLPLLGEDDRCSPLLLIVRLTGQRSPHDGL